MKQSLAVSNHESRITNYDSYFFACYYHYHYHYHEEMVKFSCFMPENSSCAFQDQARAPQ